MSDLDMWPELKHIDPDKCTCNYHQQQARTKLERRLTKIVTSLHTTEVKVSMIINHFRTNK